MQTANKPELEVPYVEINAGDIYKDGLNAHKHSASIMLRSADDVVIRPGKTVSVSTGLKISLPAGYVALICSRSSVNQFAPDIVIVNAPCIIDDLVCAYYPGPLTVQLHNFGEKDFRVRKGDRIAKLLVIPYVMPTYVKVGVLDTTEE